MGNFILTEELSVRILIAFFADGSLAGNSLPALQRRVLIVFGLIKPSLMLEVWKPSFEGKKGFLFLNALHIKFLALYI